MPFVRLIRSKVMCSVKTTVCSSIDPALWQIGRRLWCKTSSQYMGCHLSCVSLRRCALAQAVQGPEKASSLTDHSSDTMNIQITTTVCSLAVLDTSRRTFTKPLLTVRFEVTKRSKTPGAFGDLLSTSEIKISFQPSCRRAMRRQKIGVPGLI
jgi:hypothetical protein